MPFTRPLPARVAAVLLIVWICSAPPVAAQAADSVEVLLARGDAAYRQFENREALDAYTQAHALAPDDFEVLVRLARTHNDYAQDLMAEGEEREAEAQFEQAVAYAETLAERYPDRPESHFFLAATTGKLAQFKGGKDKIRIGRAVEEHSKRALALDPNYALPYVALGIFYRELDGLSWFERTFAKTFFGGLPEGDIEDSARMLERAVALDSTLVVAHYELAQTYEEMDLHEKAALHLQKVIDLPPATTADRRHQAEAMEKLNDER